MGRKWEEVIAPKYQKEVEEHPIWLKHMDQMYESDDGFIVMSCLVETVWGEMEFVYLLDNNLGDRLKQEKILILQEIFGDRRMMIEDFVFTERDKAFYWLFPEGFEIPFFISNKDIRACSFIGRGRRVDVNDYINYLGKIMNIE